MSNNLKITFAPGSFDNFNGTQEELESIIAEVYKMFETGNLSSDNIVLLGEKDLSKEEWDILENQASILKTRNLH